MTLKQFTRIVCSNDEYTGSLYCNDEPLKIDDVCGLLNEFSKENQHLNYDNKRMVKFILSKGYGLKDYLDFCKEYEE